MDLTTLAIQLLSGAAGGNIVGQALRNLSLGFLGNTLAGLVGGGLGGQILQHLLGIAAANPGALDIDSLATQVAGGGVGGGILMIVVALLRKLFAR